MLKKVFQGRLCRFCERGVQQGRHRASRIGGKTRLGARHGREEFFGARGSQLFHKHEMRRAKL